MILVSLDLCFDHIRRHWAKPIVSTRLLVRTLPGRVGRFTRIQMQPGRYPPSVAAYVAGAGSRLKVLGSLNKREFANEMHYLRVGHIRDKRPHRFGAKIFLKSP